MKSIGRFAVTMLFAGCNFLFGQENPNVELPQFVITGKQAYEFPSLEKQKPELISTVSEQFFKPVYSADVLEVKEFSEPVKKSGEFLDSINFVNGSANFLVGNNILPSLSLLYRKPMNGSILSTTVNAINQRPYLANADRNKYDVKFLFQSIISDSGSFLPFSKFEAFVNGGNESYKLFASPKPEFNRQIATGNVKVMLQNISSTKLNYEVVLEEKYLNMKNDSLNENLLKANGFAKYSANLFYASVFGKYHVLKSTFEPLSAASYTFFQAKGILGFNFGKTIKTDFGFEYSKLDSNSALHPYLATALQLWKGFSLFAEYHPTSSMLTQQDFIAANKYYSPSAKFANIFYTINSQIAVNLKYEIERSLDIACGFSYFNAADYPFFANVSSAGNIFAVDTAQAKGTTVFAKVNLFPGKYGFFTGELLFQNVHDTSWNYLPYVTPLKVQVTYGQFITDDISLSATMMYYSSPFINFANTEKGKDYLDLSFTGEMNISEKMFANLELRNIFNSKNEIWKNYQELPLSISAGLKIIW